MPWLSGYSRRYPLYANTSTIVADVTNEALPVFAPDLTGLCQSDMDDVVFTSTDGTTQLSHYWESKTLSAPVGHIKVPTLTAGQSAFLVGYMYCGNAGATDTSDEAGVFSGYVARYALSESSGTLTDSTGRGHTGTPSGSPTYGVVGKVGNGMDFELDNTQYFYAIDHADWDLASGYSLSLWLKMESTPTYQYLQNQWGNVGAGNAAWTYRLESGRPSIGNYNITSGSNFVYATNALTTNVWYHIAAVYLGGTTGTNAYHYTDGAANGSGTMATIPQTSGYTMSFGIAGTRGSTTRYDGVADEIRISSSARSASSIKAEYMAGAQTLFTLAAVQLPPPTTFVAQFGV